MTDSRLRSRIETDRKLINGWLAADLRMGRAVPARLAAAMRYSVLGRAKRLRAILALESFRAAGGRHLRMVRPLCSGIEMVQSFSLIHDDLPCMDDDDFRRGKPSLHRRYDEATAVLAGDALLIYAFELFLRCPVAPEQRDEVLRLMTIALGPAGMAGGQVLDMALQNGNGAGKGFARADRLKTAAFMAAAVEAGAVLAGADKVLRGRLRSAGMEFGLLFQATDDRLDNGQQSTGRSGDDGRKSRTGSASLSRDAERTAQLFSELGEGYRFLAALPELILNRKR